MTVEAASHIADLDPATIGDSTDPTEGGAQVSLVKTVLKTDFANITGAVTASQSDLNLVDVTTVGTAEANKALTAGTAGAIDGTLLAWSNLGTVTTCDINGGAIDGTPIGAASASTGAFTTLACTTFTPSGSVTITSGSINGTTVGATTPGTGAFTTLSASGAVTFSSGTINGTSVGATTPSTGAFTTLSASGAVTFTSGTINGTTIGATTPSTGVFTTLVANTSLVINGSTAITAIDEDLTTVSAAHDTLPSAKAVRDYFDADKDHVEYLIKIDSISTADTVWLPIGVDGNIVRVTSVIGGAISGSDATLTVQTAASAAIASLVVTQTGSAAGDVDTTTTITNAAVTAGSAIKVNTDGLSTGAVPVWISVTVQH